MFLFPKFPHMCLCHRMASAFRSMGYPLSRNLTLYSFYLTLLLDICRYFPAYKHFEKRKKIVCANSKVPKPLALPSVSVGSPSLNAAVSSNQPDFPCFQFFASLLPATPNRALTGIGVSPFPALRSCCRLHLSFDQAM